MIRTCLAVAGALLLAACGQPQPDVTARYSIAGRNGALVIKVDGNGDSRIEMDKDVLLTKDGVMYSIITDPMGTFAAKQDDLTAVSLELMRETGYTPPKPPEGPEYELVKGGEETVGAYKGTVWTLQPKGDAKAQIPGVVGVLSDDRTIAPVGHAMALRAKASNDSLSAAMGATTSLQKQTLALFEKGTVLRMGDFYKLTDVKTDPIPDSDFALPETVLDQKALRERANKLRASMMPPPAPPAKPEAGATPAKAPAK
ncbi:MAG: hypothetical protein ACOY45_15055 [Pseudomonadota bacterium]